MKIKNDVAHIFYIFLCCIISNNYYVTAQEVAEETAAQREIRESIKRAESRKAAANDLIAQAEKEKAAATTDQEKKNIELREYEAKGDLYAAQIDEQKGLLDLANQQGKADDAKQAEQALNEAKNNQEEAQKKITELTQQLTQEFVSVISTGLPPIILEAELPKYAQNLQAGTYTDEIFSKKLSYLQDLRSMALRMFRDGFIEDELKEKETTGEKLKFLDDKRMIFNNLLDSYRNELNNLDAWSRSHEITKAAEDYKSSLQNAIYDISQKKVMLDMHSASLELQNVSLFSKIVSAVKDWFDNTFGFSKKPWYKRSVDDEISKLSDIKQQIDKLKQETGVVNFANGVFAVDNGIEELKSQFEEGKYVLDLDTFEKDIAARESQLNNNFSASDLQNARRGVDAFDTLYKDSLQPMQGDMLAMSRRYLDPKSESLTLFDDLADYYTSEKIFGLLPYRPEQAYQALFTPEVIANLNATNPALKLTSAMFDPLTFDPDAISPQLIEKAYDESREVVYKMGTSAWQAARNASFILRNPVEKATYDAFLKDYKTLLSRGVKDPYKDKGRSPLDTMFLNHEGALSKIQITEATNEQLISIFGDILNTIGEQKSAFDGAGDALNKLTLGTIKQNVQTLKKNISDFTSGQQQQILGNN